MGSLFGGGDKTQQTTSTSSQVYPQWTQDAAQATSGAAYAMGAPFLQVPQSAVAGMTADQLKAFDLTRQTAQGAYTGGPTATPTSSYLPALIGSAAQRAPTMANAQTMNAGDIASYMNPYMQGVIDPAVSQARREGNATQAGIGARSAASGAFGGSREAVQRSLASRDANENITSTVANLMKSGYDNAQGYAQTQANTRQQTELANQGASQQSGLSNQAAENQFKLQQAEYNQAAAMGNPQLAMQQATTQDAMRTSDQQRQLAALQMLIGNGNQQQLFGQKAIDVPRETLEWISKFVPNVYNSNTSGTGTQPDNSPGMFQQLLGTAATIFA